MAVVVGLLALVAGSFATSPTSAHATDAIIDNGTIRLGVHDFGHLNVYTPEDVSSGGTPVTGLRYIPTNAESTAPGCLCEGWGAADAITGVTGYANESIDGVVNLTPISFVSDPTSAVSVVEINDGAAVPVLRVTHDYHPSPDTPSLYEVDVTIENVSAAVVEPRYRRVMDWDIEPTAFNEFVTVRGAATTSELLNNDNNGFDTANPLSTNFDFGSQGDYEDVGPLDHGQRFTFGFDPLAPGESKEFTTFYGAGADEAEADAAVTAGGLELVTYGQPATQDGPTLGTPNTFIFGFSGVGGDPIGNKPPDCTTATGPGALWPPNHRMEPIAISGVTDPDGDAVTVTPTAVESDEPTPGPGKKHAPDATLSPLTVRVEREGGGDGRVYEVHFTADDGKGGTCTGSILVTVPHDQDGDPAVDSGTTYDATV